MSNKKIARLFVFTIRRDEITMRTKLLCPKINFMNKTKQKKLLPSPFLFISVLFCSHFLLDVILMFTIYFYVIAKVFDSPLSEGYDVG